ncbi:unnamed protein product [Adineta ricciae]|uniref:PDZ domain-containing protein n=1 Tax=Adineta ricciae TaxID=249248 RepID=A0A815ANM4_ADIRI|nr:unnamed protein product [Adineta ricciae]
MYLVAWCRVYVLAINRSTYISNKNFFLGDVLIFLNDTNIIKPPVALSIDRVKSEFTALRRQNKTIQIGICRCADRSVFNNATVQHLGSLILHEFENLSRREESNDTQALTTIVHSESKKLLSLFSNKKKSFSIKKRKSIPKKTNETDQNKTLTVKNNENRPLVKQSPTDHVDMQSKKESSLNKLAQKLGPVHQNPSTQILTDACFIYRRQIVKQPDTNAMILRGREIAYEAANSPVLPLSMPSYSHDQIRELYGEIDRKTRRLQENQYIFHTPMIDAWNETPPWSLSSTSSLNQNQCPLPKFRLDKNDQTLLMTSFLSTGLSNRPTPSGSNEKDAIRGSFRTSVGERTSVSPSPLLLNVRFDYNKVDSTGMTSKDETSFFNDIQQKISIEKTSDIISAFDLDFLQQNDSKQSIEPTNDVNSSPPKLDPPVIKSDDDAIDIDSLIDIDEQTALAYHMDKESSIDAELHSLFSVPNPATICTHPQAVDSHEIVKQDNRMNTITSPDDSCYHDALTSSIQSSIFSDNFFEQIETLNHINKIQKLESLHVDESNTPCEINQNPACLYHLVFSYDEQLIEEQDDGVTNTESVSNLTQDRAVVQRESPTNDENNYRQITSDIDEDFEELYQRYLTNLSQYHKILEQIEEVEQKQKQLSPIDENPNVKEFNSNNFQLSVQRQGNHIGHYGFEIDQTLDEKIKISSIIDSTYCPGLNVGDEIVGIDNISALASLEQYHLLLNSLWHDQCEYLDLIVKKPLNIPTGAVCQPVSSHSNILSWPIPKAETALNITDCFS